MSATTRGSVEDSEWIRRVLQQHLEGRGQDATVVEVRPFHGSGVGFASELFEVVTRGAPLVAKLLPEIPRGTYRNLDQQFLNERHFYKEVLPLLVSTCTQGIHPVLAHQLFPTFFCAHQDNSRSLIAVEDLRPRGFVHAEGILNESHVRVALKGLARFHALSYVAKKKDLESFLTVVNRVRQTRTEEICSEISPMMKDYLEFAAETFRRCFPADSGKFADKLRGLPDLADAFAELTEPTEPLAVCCHGDFHSGNILFEYGGDGGPMSTRFVDFQLKSYSSPAVDISLLLFLSSSQDVLRLSWEELLGSYHASVLAEMEEVLGCPRDVLELDQPFEALLEDFRRHSVHGFLVAVFFLPVATLDARRRDAIAHQVPGDVTAPANSREFASLVRQHCRQEVMFRIATLLKVMMDRNYI